jgi:hypothetical protein
MKAKIEFPDPIANGVSLSNRTMVRNAETGEVIPEVTAIDIRVEVDQPIRAVIYCNAVKLPRVLIAEGEIKHADSD